MTGGIDMECVGAEDNAVRYNFTYTPEYSYAEQFYQEAVASMDPNNFVLLLQQHPYHVGTLLQLAHAMRSQGDAEVPASCATSTALYRLLVSSQGADQLVQRALYAFECAFHPRFKPQEGASRLTHGEDHPGNSLFFEALWQRVLSVGRRGGCCHVRFSHISVLSLCLLGSPQLITYAGCCCPSILWATPKVLSRLSITTPYVAARSAACCSLQQPTRACGHSLCCRIWLFHWHWP